MKRILLLAAMLGLFVTEAHAQMYVGGGAYMGQGGGNCMPQIPREVSRIEKSQKDLDKQLKKNDEALDKAERDRDKYKRDADRDTKGINGWLKPYAAQATIDWVKSGKSSEQTYEQECQNGAVVAGEEGKVPKTWDGAFCGSYGANVTNSKQCTAQNPCAGGVLPNAAAKAWVEVTTSGPNSQAICYDHADFVQDKNVPNIQSTWSGGKDCKAGIDGLKDDWDKYNQADSEVKRLQAEADSLQNRSDDLDADHSDAVNRWQDHSADGQSAGGFCYTCMFGGSPERSTASNVMSLVGTLASAGALYGAVRYTNDQNSALGWPTSPWMAYGMGYPLVMSSIYGGMYGGGSGSFGCSGGMGGGGMGGAFGYPGGMMGGMGGGMMMPGAMPMMGMGMMGYPMMGYPGMMMGMGAMGGMMMGMPMMGMPMAGMPMSGGMMMGLGMGMMSGMPMMGMPMSGGMMMGMPMSGGMMMGMPMSGGMMMGVGMMSGMPMMGYMSGVPFMGMTMGYPMSGMMSGYNPMMMQYQQQMLGMYQQQAQQYMMQQQQQMQGSMMIGQLQSQMMQIGMQIQQISAGVYGGGGMGLGGYGMGGYPGSSMYGSPYGSSYGAGVGGAPAGFTYAPYNPFGSTLGTTTTGTTVIPGRGTGFMPSSN